MQNHQRTLKWQCPRISLQMSSIFSISYKNIKQRRSNNNDKILHDNLSLNNIKIIRSNNSMHRTGHPKMRNLRPRPLLPNLPINRTILKKNVNNVKPIRISKARNNKIHEIRHIIINRWRWKRSIWLINKTIIISTSSNIRSIWYVI